MTNQPQGTSSLADDAIRVTCTCGHSDQWQRFARNENGQALPPNEWRCPACWTHVRLSPVREDVRWPEVRLTVVRSGRRAA